MRIQIEMEFFDCTLHSLVKSQYSIIEISSETQEQTHVRLLRSFSQEKQLRSSRDSQWCVISPPLGAHFILSSYFIMSISFLSLTNNPDAQTRSSNAWLSCERLLDDWQQKHPEVLREISSICRETRIASPFCRGACNCWEMRLWLFNTSRD